MGRLLQISFWGVPHQRRLSDFIRCAWMSMRRGRGHGKVFDVGRHRFSLLVGWFLIERDHPSQRQHVSARRWARQLQHCNPGQSLVRFSPWHSRAHAPSHNLHRATTARTLQNRTQGLCFAMSAVFALLVMRRPSIRLCCGGWSGGLASLQIQTTSCRCW